MGQSLVDLAALDLTRDVLSQEELRRLLPHRHEFQLIDGVCHLDYTEGLIVGYKDWDADAWWGKGHIPNRPLMPGVLMVEGAAQISSILMKKVSGWAPDRFIGMAGLEETRFRGTIVPPCRVHFVARSGTTSTRLAKYPAQCYLNNKMVMETIILGVPL